MLLHFKKGIIVLLLLGISETFVNCSSAEKFNQKIAQPISVEKLNKDIDFVTHNLTKYYPNLHRYISKSDLDYKFDSLRQTITKPMTSKELFFALSPIIASVKQCNIHLAFVPQKISKKETKRLKKAGIGPLSQYGFQYQDDKMYINKNKSKTNTIEIGTEIVSINGISPQQIYQKYNRANTSDGYNTTFMPGIFTKRYSSYLTEELGIQDSLNFVLKNKDSVFSKIVVREKPKKPTETEIKATKDSIANGTKIALSKKAKKAEKRFKSTYGYDAKEKEFAKEFSIVKTDSTVAVLKIRTFSKGDYATIYEEVFDSIKKLKIKNLVLDLRNNTGGRVADVVDLYSYFNTDKHKLLFPATVTSKTSLWKSKITKNFPIYTYPLFPIIYPTYMGITYFKTTKVGDDDYRFSISGSKAKKPKDDNFQGKTYVIINGSSYSATSIISAALRQNPDITFIGEETGGALKGCVAGQMPVVKLPNSKLGLRLGLMDIQSINQSGPDGRGIFPDVNLSQTIQDKAANIDPEMDWILNDVKEKRTKG